MRVLLLGSALALATGCAAARHTSGLVAEGVRGPDVPPTVLRSAAEFDDFLRRARELPGGDQPGGLAQTLEAARPNFGRQVLVLVRHDTSSGSTFAASTAGTGRGSLAVAIRTRRQGTTRDMVPYWFAVTADQPGPERVEVNVDGQPQRPAGP